MEDLRLHIWVLDPDVEVYDRIDSIGDYPGACTLLLLDGPGDLIQLSKTREAESPDVALVDASYLVLPGAVRSPLAEASWCSLVFALDGMPVVVVGASSHLELQGAGRVGQLDIRGFLPRPFTPEDLARVLILALGLTTQARQSASTNGPQEAGGHLHAEDDQEVSLLDSIEPELEPEPEVEPRLELERDMVQEPRPTTGIKDAGQVVFDVERRTITAGDGSAKASPNEFQLFRLLYESDGMAASREFLFDAVWGQANVGAKTLDVHLSKLRKKIAPLGIHIVLQRPGTYRLVLGEVSAGEEGDEGGGGDVAA